MISSSGVADITAEGRQAMNRGDFELSNGADPLDELLAELDDTEQEWAHGASLYGPGGLFNDQRKAFLAVQASEIREMLKAQGGKTTDGLIDEMSHADPEYRAWLDKHELARAKWLALSAHRDNIQARIMRGNALLRVAARFVA